MLAAVHRPRSGLRTLALLCLLGLTPALSGCVGAAVGAGAAVATAAAQEKGIGAAATDIRIRTEINALWLKEDEDLLHDIELQVQEGRVLLSGVTPDPQVRLNAVRLCWQVDGVVEVINEIQVSDKSGFTDYARDTLISSELRSTLLLDKEVSSLNYSIETVNQTIFLMGVAQNQDELNRVVDHARNIAYVRGVRTYVRVKKPEDEG